MNTTILIPHLVYYAVVAIFQSSNCVHCRIPAYLFERQTIKMSDQGAGAGSPSPVAPSLQLKEREKEILERQIHTSESNISRLKLLYTCATTYELFALIISSIAAIVGGALQPISFVSCSS